MSFDTLGKFMSNPNKSIGNLKSWKVPNVVDNNKYTVENLLSNDENPFLAVYDNNDNKEVLSENLIYKGYIRHLVLNYNVGKELLDILRFL